MSVALKQLKDIPTIAYLYRTKALKQSSNTDLSKGAQESNDKVCTIQYDITKLEVDAIVNAANRSLLGGGGVDGAIHAAAGPDLLDECRTLGGCATGSAKITDAYNLPCKKVIHAVGPIYSNADQSEPLLRGCYRTALQLLVDNGCKSIAFSAISTGIYGYPSNAAARAALREVASFLRRPEGKSIEKVVFCNFLDKDVRAYAAAIPDVFPPTEDDLSESVSTLLESESTLEIVQKEKTSSGKNSIQGRSPSSENVSTKCVDEHLHEGLDKDDESGEESGHVSKNGHQTPESVEKAVQEKDIQESDETRSTSRINWRSDNLDDTAEESELRTDDTTWVTISGIDSTDDNISLQHNHANYAGDEFAYKENGERSGDDSRTEYWQSRLKTEARGELRLKPEPTTPITLSLQEPGSADDTDEETTSYNPFQCSHSWQLVNNKNNISLWPKDRLRCMDCGAWGKDGWAGIAQIGWSKIARK